MNIPEKMGRLKITSLIYGILIGLIIGVILELIYVDIFHEAGKQFYFFTGLALLGGPVIGAVISALIVKQHKLPTLFLSGGVAFLIMLALLVVFYMVFPLFTYDSIQVPADCIDNASCNGSHIPPSLNYAIPGIGNGTTITSDNNSAIVVMSDYDHLPYRSTVYVIHKNDSKIIRSLTFDNDIIAAAIDDRTLYIFNDKILYSVDTNTGENMNDIVKFDNYRGVYTVNNNTYMQTTFEVSILRRDGSVLPHLRMNMSCIAYGCLVTPATA